MGLTSLNQPQPSAVYTKSTVNASPVSTASSLMDWSIVHDHCSSAGLSVYYMDNTTLLDFYSPWHCILYMKRCSLHDV